MREANKLGSGVAALAAMALVVIPLAQPRATSATDPTVDELLRKTDDLFRGSSSEGIISMRVKTARWDRSLTMKVRSEGAEKTLIQILSPAKERGTATLKVENNIWNYLPKVDRTIKVPASMMAGAWMGSHFTNDDLVQDSRFSDDYGCELTGSPGDHQGHFIITCTPKPDAPVVWGRVELRLRAADELIQESRFFTEKGRLVRTLTYTDVGELGGRTLPRCTRLVPADKPGEFTEVTYEELEFDVKLPTRTFTLQALRR